MVTMDSELPLGESNLVEIEIPSRVDMVAVVRMIVAAATNAVEAIHGDRLDDLRWVTSEATTNAIEANLSHADDGRVQVRCEVAEGCVRLMVSDQGPGMPARATVRELAYCQPLVGGSLGIPLMKHFSNAWSFNSGLNGTTVHMELYQ